jgi:hypothetical protein
MLVLATDAMQDHQQQMCLNCAIYNTYARDDDDARYSQKKHISFAAASNCQGCCDATKGSGD